MGALTIQMALDEIVDNYENRYIEGNSFLEYEEDYFFGKSLN